MFHGDLSNFTGTECSEPKTVDFLFIFIHGLEKRFLVSLLVIGKSTDAKKKKGFGGYIFKIIPGG